MMGRHPKVSLSVPSAEADGAARRPMRRTASGGSAGQLALPLAPRSKPAGGTLGALRVVDLFCGCGGMSLGFQEAGFTIAAACDNWKPALDVYSDNFSHKATLCDLSDPATDDMVRGYRPDVIIGGPPCQDFSSAGPNDHASGRAGLIERFVALVAAGDPMYFVMENVPRTRLRPVFKRAETRLRALGYGLTVRVLDASLCGVPQLRERLFVIGAKGAAEGFLTGHLEERLAARPLTLRQYFGSSLGTEYYFRVPTNYGRRGVFSIDEPCVTIRAVDRPIPSGYPGHPDDSAPIGPAVRPFTVLERSYIQTFPKTFRFTGTKSNQNTMIGNAVPVRLARYVAEALARYIKDVDET